MINERRTASHLAALLLMSASGFAGLGYQIIWTQQCALWLGHEAAALLAVVTAFFGGLALGSFLFGPRIERSLRPLRWYAACELVIASWSLLLLLIMAPLSTMLLKWTGIHDGAVWTNAVRQWAVAFIGTFVLLLPATLAMGATLPAMERLTTQWHGARRSIAGLYASNTLGAVIGVMATAFWLIPALGLLRTTLICIGLNATCCAIALRLFDATTPTAPPQHTAAATMPWLRLAITGLLGIGYEVLVVRVLSQVAEDTIYTFAILLAVYLMGSALGASIYARLSAKGRQPSSDLLLVALAVTCLAGTISLWFAEQVKLLAIQILGFGMAAAIGAESLLALLAFAPATLVMGALFSHLNAQANSAGMSFGRAMAINTLGATAAPLLFGVIMLPLLGSKWTLLLISCGYLALIARHHWLRPTTLVTALAIVIMMVWAPPLRFIETPEGGRVVRYEEGVMAAVSVVEDANGVARLRINNRQQEGSNASLRVDGRQALLPLLLHPTPQRALFLGLGTGVTASTAAMDPTLQVDAVELLPEVVRASSYFTHELLNRPGVMPLHVFSADARRYVRVSNRQYQVIVADNFHPARSGTASLYTIEHFRAVQARLSSDGVFCQWLPLHQLDLETLKNIVQSFIAVYPRGWAMLASNSLETPVLGLIGRADGKTFELESLRARLASAALPERLDSFGIEDEFALLGGFVAGPEALMRFAGNAIANTDDLPIVAYRAPRITYAPDSLPRDRLLALLQQWHIKPQELLTHGSNPWAQRLDAYWRARNQFITSGRDIQPIADVQLMLAQVRQPLLNVLRISPEFRPAYDPLLSMAKALSSRDANAARELLQALVSVQPERSEAKTALHELDEFTR